MNGEINSADDSGETSINSGERFIVLFDQLCSLPASLRQTKLSELNLSQGERDQLARLLRAHDDAEPDAQSIIEKAATQFVGAPVRQMGTVMGDYRVLKQLGAGGMGAVLLAERADSQYQSLVALKLLRGFPTEDGIRRLRQERQILAELDHPNIARLLDGGETEQGEPFLVMEFVAGMPLIEYLQSTQTQTGVLKLKTLLNLFERILSAVEHAHQRLVIHRDIKPSNILVREDGEPKLLDFGIAKLLDIDLSHSQRHTSTRVFTPGYASPEQQRGDLITVASDVFSLGVLLREMLAATGLGVGRSQAELRGIVKKATEAEVKNRYPSVEALREDLSRLQQGLPVRAAADTAWYRARKFAFRHRLGLCTSAAIVLLASMLIWQLNSARNRALLAQQEAKAQADAAKASNDFLVSLFQFANPLTGGSANVSALDLLDRGRDKVQTDLSTQPQIGAMMLEQLSRAYIGMGQYDQALNLANEAVRLTPSTEIAHYRRQHASISAMVRSGRYQEALQLIDHSQAAMQAQNLHDASISVSMLNSRVMALKWLERGDEAVLDLQRIMQLLPELGESHDEQSAYALDNLANTYESVGRFDDALVTAERAEQAFIKLRGEGAIEPLMVGRYRGVLALLLDQAGATEKLQSILAKMRIVVPPNDRRLTNTQTSLAAAYLRAGLIDQANNELEEARTRCLLQPGPAYKNCPITLLRLGELHLAQGKSKQALDEIQRVMELQLADQNVSELVRDRTRLVLALGLCRIGQSAASKKIYVALEKTFFQNQRVAAAEKLRGEKDYLACREN